MSSVEAPAELRAGEEGEGFSGRSLGWWGLAALIATEGTMFALLLFAYLQLRIQADDWPLGDIADPELRKSGLRTVILLASSIPLHIADRAAERGDRRRVSWGLGLGWLMGAVFLAGHFEEWHKILKEFTPGTNAYGSAFYTITGFHAAHLAVGLIVIGYLYAGSVAGRYEGRGTNSLHNGVLYWHFVDVVWVAVYTILYLTV